MYCTKCGNSVIAGARFCEFCGTAVVADTPEPTGNAATAQPLTATTQGAPGTTGAPAPSVTGAPAQGAPGAAAMPVANGTATEPRVINNSGSGADGINKCPYCGSSDIQLNIATGQLHCNYCHREWSEEADGINYDISKLSGLTIGAASDDINYDASTVVTLKCTACGAEVVIDTAQAPQSRCHWCRNTLSLNNQVPNGAIPDAVLPFKITKENAQNLIQKFVGKRKFFAHPKFKSEFSTDNIMGVYLPYMVVDVNAHSSMQGQAEHQTRKYKIKDDTYYDADLYDIGRDFDLLIDDLTVEASSERLNQNTAVNSNNVINSILPYPLKDTLRFNANYLKGFTSEKRDVNREAIANVVAAQIRDIARYQAKTTAQFYDRGIRWDRLDVAIKGQLWKTVYLPVWLYSYLEVKGNGKKFLHYVAVNGATGETMGSVPIHMPKLLLVSGIIELIGCAIGIPLAIFMFLFGS